MAWASPRSRLGTLKAEGLPWRVLGGWGRGRPGFPRQYQFSALTSGSRVTVCHFFWKHPPRRLHQQLSRPHGEMWSHRSQGLACSQGPKQVQEARGPQCPLTFIKGPIEAPKFPYHVEPQPRPHSIPCSRSAATGPAEVPRQGSLRPEPAPPWASPPTSLSRSLSLWKRTRERRSRRGHVC